MRALLHVAMAALAAACAQPEADRCDHFRPVGVDLGLCDLVWQASSLETLAQEPAFPYRTLLSSSYDRSSASPEAAQSWYANRDDTGFVRVSGGLRVLLDTEGPGVVTRIWSANPHGRLLVFVDEQPSPALEADMADLLSGGVEPFIAPYGYVAARGYNLHFPIPFSQRCVVAVTGDEDMYYQVTYRRYGDGTRVEPFSMERADSLSSVIGEVARRLLAGGGTAPQEATVRFASSVRAGDEWEQQVDSSPVGSAIRRLRIRPTPATPDILRRSILMLSFDGVETVKAPLGDFFGSGPGVNPTRNLVTSVEPDGILEARWVMPFTDHAVLRVRAPEDADLHLELDVDVASHPSPDVPVYFNARWHPTGPVVTEEPRDWHALRVEGRGTYVGNTLNVVNTSEAWWGEGDEKIYVDDEEFPGIFGTGTEDYYGYAWYDTELFSSPYHGQTRADGPRNQGRTSLYRWHVLDPIHFSSRLVFDLELLHWRMGTDAVEIAYDMVHFWYAPLESRAYPPAAEASDFRIPLEDALPP